MKKIFYIFFILSFIFYRLSFVNPIIAISWSDLFPPLQMKADTKYGNPPTLNVDTIGARGVSDSTYINKLVDYIECKSGITVSNSWSAPTQTKYDTNGKPIGSSPVLPFNAFDLDSNQTIDKLSNIFNRISTYMDRTTPTTDIAVTEDNFKQMGIKGNGAFSRMYSVNQKRCLQSYAMEETIKSLEGKPTDYADIQLAWDCGGTVIETTNTAIKPDNQSCRPITIGELAYFYFNNLDKNQQDPLLVDSCESPTAKSFPDIVGKYGKLYTSQYHRSINPLPESEYSKLREHLPVKAQGPSNQTFTITNFDCVDSQAPNFKPGCPVDDTKNRVIPLSAAGNSRLSLMTDSVINQNLPDDQKFATPFSCENFAITGAQGVDTPTILAFTAYVKGLIKVVTDKPADSFSSQNPTTQRFEKSIADMATNVTNSIANFIPIGSALDDLKNTPASSKVTADNPIDPGNQADKANCYLYKYLTPENWQTANNDCL